MLSLNHLVSSLHFYRWGNQGPRRHILACICHSYFTFRGHFLSPPPPLPPHHLPPKFLRTKVIMSCAFSAFTTAPTSLLSFPTQDQERGWAHDVSEGRNGLNWAPAERGLFGGTEFGLWVYTCLGLAHWVVKSNGPKEICQVCSFVYLTKL